MLFNFNFDLLNRALLSTYFLSYDSPHKQYYCLIGLFYPSSYSTHPRFDTCFCHELKRILLDKNIFFSPSAMSGWVTRRLVLAASAAAPKPTPSVRFAAGDASVAAWSCGRPKIGGTAGVLGLRGAAAIQYQTRRFHGAWGPSSALGPELSLPISSRSSSQSMSSLSSSYSSWSSSSSRRSGIRRYVC